MNRAMLVGRGGATAAILVFVVAMLVIDGARSDVIADDVRIGGLDVGGMDSDEARSLVHRELGDAVGDPVAATYRKQRFVLAPADAQAKLGPASRSSRPA